MGIIADMVRDAPDQVSQLEDSISNLNNQIIELQKKQDALEDVCDQASLYLETYLLNTKFSPPESYIFYEGPNFNQSLSDTGNFTDWKVYELILSNVNTFSDSSFICDGDQTLIFIVDMDLAFQVESNPVLYSLVDSSSYDAFFDKTTVTIKDAILPVLSIVDKIFQFHYEYLTGDDTTVDTYKGYWDFTQDYIILPLGTSGTYGVQDMISKLGSAKDMIEINKNKIYNSIANLTPFI